ncbi:MAG: leucine-rich repeat-containing serine/threonine-protein kinase [Ferrovibrio sp.]|uniref:leucine-rich repeat-containing protein kinase family protein n=1 Tax=Ferrovibrio sp. TaxID=1917215 RepID=UPI00263535D7|nr:leucine-rich repeat-containing protein kinase family protein [Ferrovibrio sp.]MCW0235762.1 leucine-rich repeat-containing serine/threonine-protein kinase [Ferrovibrio sp.]
MHTLAQLRSGELAGIRRLDLSCGLSELPREVFDLADTLEVLNLSGNALSTLPDDLPRLTRLRVLFCSDNSFTELPAVVGQCPALDTVGFKANRIRHVPAAALSPQLRWLILTDNCITELPAAIGRCTRLQKLMLAGNQLTQLPAEMAGCTGLELLRIAANQLASLPAWLFDLPRLSWLAYAGNPFSDISEAEAVAEHPAADIAWPRLTLQTQLGEGASGVIHRALWQRDTASAPALPVAVKLFKGAVTSDGLPRSEMDACIAAGRHPNLIPVEGRISGHPQATPGLVMQLIDPVFRNLAGPPSLASCTRDVYPPGTRWSADTAVKMARGLAAATAHLHARGILHGDLYAHNTLWNGAGDCLIGDFGAASFFAPGAAAQSQALQRLEVRAYGCLLEELLQHCDEPAAVANDSRLTQLAALKARCLQAPLAQRPLMDEIECELAAL